jgi:mono/diheme cytochrome c family protein
VLSLSLLIVILLTVTGFGCRREPPKTPTAATANYHVDWPTTRGSELYSYYCLACHGPAGRGDGFNARRLAKPPRDFQDRRRMAGLTDQHLTAVIRSGGAAAGLSAAMPAWGASVKDLEIDYLVAYLRTLERPPAKR